MKQNHILATIGALVLGCLLPQASFADEKMAPGPKEVQPAVVPETTTSGDKLNIDSLEKKYWSIKDDEFTVVQNRSFTKEKKMYFSLLSGRLINDGFSTGSPTAFSVGYYRSERWGVEYMQQRIGTRANSVTSGFQTQNGALPDYNVPLDTASLGLVIVPFYAKVSLFEKMILYFDLGFILSIGQTRYLMMGQEGPLQKSSSNYGIDIFQQWFINKNWAVRFDINSKWQNESERKYYLQQNATQRDLGLKQHLDSTWLFGLTYIVGQ